MSSSKIVLFDLPSKQDNHSWSLNTWKTRLVLNYKGLDYETEWLEYPEIKPRFLAHFPEDTEKYTLPVVKLPDGTYIMDSWKIAQELEKRYPSPSLHLDSPLREKYNAEVNGAFGGLAPEIALNVPNKLLNPVNHTYWHETRSQWFGMPLEQFVKEKGGEQAYQTAAPHLLKMTELLKENNEGPFFMGNTVSFTDFIHAGVLIMFRRMGDDVFQSLLKATGEPELHLKFLEALKTWTERDNY